MVSKCVALSPIVEQTDCYLLLNNEQNFEQWGKLGQLLLQTGSLHKIATSPASNKMGQLDSQCPIPPQAKQIHLSLIKDFN